MMDSPSRSNNILASLAPTDRDALLPHMRTLDLPQGKLLLEAGAPVKTIIFPHAGIISLVVGLASGEIIEIAMIGRESALGASAVLNGGISLNRAMVQIAGTATEIDVEHARHVAEQNVAFRATLMKHEQVLLAQSQQSAACNVVHALEARLARWLLRARDSVGSESLVLTQEFVAEMLGVRRTSVSIVANTLQKAGLIRYRRGHIQLLNLEGLRECACECYGTVKSISDRLIGPLPG